MSEIVRCGWADGDPLMERYHDTEWGCPCRDDRSLFEHLVLDSAQAGLSWLTILRKREGYRNAFANFDAETVARFTNDDVERLMMDAGIVRNRAKITAAIDLAKGVPRIQEEFGSLAEYIWRFVDGRPFVRSASTLAEIPTTCPEAEVLSKDLKARGFRFVGPTIIYAFMQAAGLVNDHLTGCFRYNELCGPTGSPKGS